jgi:hypothetical protein
MSVALTLRKHLMGNGSVEMIFADPKQVSIYPEKQWVIHCFSFWETAHFGLRDSYWSQIRI